VKYEGFALFAFCGDESSQRDCEAGCYGGEPFCRFAQGEEWDFTFHLPCCMVFFLLGLVFENACKDWNTRWRIAQHFLVNQSPGNPKLV